MFRNPTTDVILVLVLVLLFFGPKRLPAAARGLGEGIREFKDSITGRSRAEDQSALTGARPGAASDKPEATQAQASSDS